MAMEGTRKCVKYLVFSFNFFFCLCGLAFVVLGVFFQVSIHHTYIIRDLPGSGGPFVLIVIGLIIFIIAFFGCCGAWKENHCMVTMFAILLSVILILEIGAVIAGYIFRNKITDFTHSTLTAHINKYSDSNKHFKDTVDLMQTRLKCCGVNSSADWKDFGTDNKSVPDSCCLNVTEGCGIGAMEDEEKVYKEGCLFAVEDLLQGEILWVIVASIIIACVQMLGIMFSCFLMRAIRKAYENM